MTHQRYLLDIETQQDLFQCGYIARDTGPIIENIYRLFDWVRGNQVPVISTVLRVRAFERGPFGCQPHCVEGTEGEAKLPGTILASRINLGLRNSTDLPADLFSHYQQAVFEKRDTDIFKHTRLERLVTELGSATFIICGAGIGQGIVQAAVGLRSRGMGVILARDAVMEFEDPLAPMAWLRMEAKGVIFASTADIIGPRKTLRKAPFKAAQKVGQTSGR